MLSTRSRTQKATERVTVDTQYPDLAIPERQKVDSRSPGSMRVVGGRVVGGRVPLCREGGS